MEHCFGFPYPHAFRLKDYIDEEPASIFVRNIEQKSRKSRMSIGGGLLRLYVSIVVRMRRGRDSVGNPRAAGHSLLDRSSNPASGEKIERMSRMTGNRAMLE